MSKLLRPSLRSSLLCTCCPTTTTTTSRTSRTTRTSWTTRTTRTSWTKRPTRTFGSPSPTTTTTTTTTMPSCLCHPVCPSMPSCLLPTEEALGNELLKPSYCLEWLICLLPITIFQLHTSENYINLFHKSIF